MDGLYIKSVRIDETLPEGSYFSHIPSIVQLTNKELHFDKEVSLFVGENGSGKSTLLEALAIACGFNPEGGSFYNFASEVDVLNSGGGQPLINYYGGVSLHEQSHGESFLALVKNRFSGKGLYLLDEPEAALSPARLMQLLVHIHDLVEKDSQFIISTHSPILMSYPDADLFELSEKGIQKTSYHETEHYRILKAFIDKPEVMYHHLFEEKENS